MKTHFLIKFAALMMVCCMYFGCKPEEQLGSIYGTVTDYATGDPVGNANVKLRPSGETTLTGSDGTFEFNDLKADKYSLLITKAEYADLDDDYIIELEAGKQIKRDVQIRKRMASLQITDMAGHSLDTLDFGDQESVKIKTFNVFNDGTETLTCTVAYDCEWITNVTGLENQIQPGKTVPVTVKIDRVALTDGVNTTFLYITSANGSNELVIKATFRGTVVISTKEASEVGSSSATVGGRITDDGGRPVTARGVCYGTSQSPDINGLHTEDGSGTGEFSHNITGLSASTTYYARAYATNRNGTYYASNIVSFTTTDGLPTVTTVSVTNITATTAKCGGNVTNNGGHNVTARGVCWNTMGSPDLNDPHTTNGNGNGAFTSNITDLVVGSTYYVRAYATNSEGTSYGDELSFTTNDGSITVTTANVTNVTPTSAMCGGEVTVSAGNTFPVLERGVCWATTHNPNVSGEHTSDGSGAGTYTSSITGLTVNTTYYVRAYATNQQGTYYGEEKTFSTTSGLPTVTTKSITDIAPLSATGGGNVTSDHGFPVTARGVCWSTVSNPTINDNHTTNGTGMGEFNSAISGLQNSTTYHVRAYATNSKGTAYGEDKSFTTTSGIITVTTNSVTGIGPSGATCGGNATVTGDNNLPITAKGVCWGTGHNPMVSGSHTNDGSGPGAFTSTISGLSINTLYYVRAYATNQLGTYYGEEKSFTTAVGLPAVTTTDPSLNGTTVTTGGNVTSDGGYNVTARGVCYGPLPNPDLSSTYSHTTDGSGTGYFSSTFSLPGGSGRYYIRAYATNANGTVYGEQKSIIQPYDELPTFTYDGNTYRVAPEANNQLSWANAYSYCNNLTLYGYSDWKLPTQGELLQMYNDRVSIGGFGNYNYWSSSYVSHYGNPFYIYINFSNGNVYNTYDNSGSNSSMYAVRPVRQESGGGTTPVAPTVTTTSPTNVTSSSATCGGNVTSDGGATVTSRGVCYDTSPNPTTSSQTVSGGSGTGSFTCSLTGLSSNTTYYVRAYAINSAGTAYGNQESFTTQSGGGGGQTYSYDFDAGMQNWTSVDADGDGLGWAHSSDPGVYHNSGVNLSGSGHNASEAYVLSGSYANQTQTALTPDNYLVSPQRLTVSTGASISFYVCAQDNNYADEHYGVAVSTSSSPTAGSFTTIWEETLSAKRKANGKPRGTTTQGTWYLKTIDLSAYAGQSIWIAIRHFNCTDQFIINVDDITINTGN
ncbi:MAG: choice-of-anchor J domain-containing protein [Bacteroidales bacterium]|nr:choice-of-anchor J domain-containing protein [Bacteroidales bacterium]